MTQLDRKRLHKQKSSIEPILYEIKPYFIAGIGLFALLSPIAPAGIALRVPFAFILLFCAALIFKWRAEHRFARR